MSAVVDLSMTKCVYIFSLGIQHSIRREMEMLFIMTIVLHTQITNRDEHIYG